MRLLAVATAILALGTSARAETKKPAPGAGTDFAAQARALFRLAACGGDDAIPERIAAKTIERHCREMKETYASYRKAWADPAGKFIGGLRPADAPKTVVYPFGGGDLVSALVAFPDADEITTISLEPAGDPRTLAVLEGKDLEHALGKVQYELKFLYRANFSNTLNMIEAMRGGALPVQLIFGLSALKLHGYELVKLRYFGLETDGAIHYIDESDLANAPDPGKTSAQKRNRVFANAEVQFKKPGGRVQVWRHIRANLGNEDGKGIGVGLKSDPRVVRHLEAKGQVAGMTKAASYLLSWDSFSIMRDYLVKHVVWMVSDATGVAPKWGKPAGYEYETYGSFVDPHIEAGTGISSDWKKEWQSQPTRSINFRFGYYDKKLKNHLVIMRRKS
jgi:hypothetical protein